MSKEPSEFARLYPHFEELFPDDETCALFVLDHKWSEGMPCNHCGSKDNIESKAFRVKICANCGKENRIFNGTIFFRKKRIRAWFAGLWFTNLGVEFSDSEFAKLIGVALSTAQLVSKTIAYLSLSKLEDLPLVPSSEFLEIFGRRSLETPANEHPKKEQYILEQQENVQNQKKNPDSTDSKQDSEKQDSEKQDSEKQDSDNRDSEQQNCDATSKESTQSKASEDENFLDAINQLIGLTAQERSVLKVMMTAELISVDDIAEGTGLDIGELFSLLSMLELKGLIKLLPGQLFKMVKQNAKPSQEMPEEQQQSVRQFINSSKTVRHRVSRKYLQLYLALYWCRLQKKVWKENELIFHFIDVEPVTRQDLLAYVTPLHVRVPLAS